LWIAAGSLDKNPARLKKLLDGDAEFLADSSQPAYNLRQFPAT
jgi:hypothetical protein